MNYSDCQYIAFIFLIYQRIAMSLLQWLIFTLDNQQTNCQNRIKETLQYLINVLIKIDAIFFAQMTNLEQSEYNELDVQKVILEKIEKYLYQYQHKKLRKEFVNLMKQNNDWNQLNSLILFLSIHSDLKPEIIQQIITLTNAQQKIIMQSIKKIEDNCQTAFDFKKVIQRMEKLERNNDNLREKINAQTDQLHIQQLRVDELREDNYILETNRQKYAQEKKNLFEELVLYQLSQFIDLCFLIKQQTQTNTTIYNDLISQNKKLSNHKKQLRKQLLNYGVTIMGKMEELQKIKLLCQQANDQYLEAQDLMIPKLVLGDNTNRANIKSGRSNKERKIQTDRTNCSSCRDEEQEHYINLGKLFTLRQLQTELSQKQEQMKELMRMNEIEKKKLRFFSRKLVKLKCEHQKHMARYLQNCSNQMK